MKNRRDFISDSARIAGVVAGISALGITHLMADSKQDLRKDSKQDSTKAKKMTQNSNPQIWYITGASGGLGFALAKYLLEKGDKVAGTSRSLKNIESKFGKESEHFLPLELNFDKNMAKNIEANFEAIKSKFGRIDNFW